MLASLTSARMVLRAKLSCCFMLSLQRKGSAPLSEVGLSLNEWWPMFIILRMICTREKLGGRNRDLLQVSRQPKFHWNLVGWWKSKRVERTSKPCSVVEDDVTMKCGWLGILETLQYYKPKGRIPGKHRHTYCIFIRMYVSSHVWFWQNSQGGGASLYNFAS